MRTLRRKLGPLVWVIISLLVISRMVKRASRGLFPERLDGVEQKDNKNLAIAEDRSRKDHALIQNGTIRGTSREEATVDGDSTTDTAEGDGLKENTPNTMIKDASSKQRSKKRFQLAPDEEALVEILNSQQRRSGDMDVDVIPLLLWNAPARNRTANTTSTTPQHVRHLHVAFIGDSVVRYLYNSVALFLHTGVWPDPNPQSRRDNKMNVAYTQGSARMDEFFRFTKKQLAPNEQCDCYRGPKKYEASVSFENHYYVDPSRNLSLTYISRMGMGPSHGHWITRNETVQPHRLFTPARPNTNYTWVYDRTWHIVDQLLGSAHLNVDIVVMHQGTWASHDFQLDKHPQHLQQIQDSLRKHGMKGVYWKHPVRMGEHQSTYCAALDRCLDSEVWMQPTEKKANHTFDGKHYKPYMYKAFGLQLLDAIASMTD